jgi:hypothetical protein
MLHTQTSAITSNTSRTIAAINGQSQPFSEVLVMPKWLLLYLLDNNHASLGVEAADIRSRIALLALDADVSVVTLMETPPREPPDENQGLQGGAVAGVVDVELQGALTVRRMGEADVTELEQLVQMSIDRYLESATVEANLRPLEASVENAVQEQSEQRLVNDLGGGGLVHSAPSLGGMTWTDRRSRRHWHTRTLPHRGPGPLATVVDGFKHPPDVG